MAERVAVIIRALIAFLLLPGIVAGMIPALIVSSDAHRVGGWIGGYIVLGTGIVLLLWCVRDFLVSGCGTLAPWDPPKKLVTVGLYRCVRNPMYLAVLTILIGWSVAAGSRLLGGYALVVAIAVHLRVVFYEEPCLRRKFGDEWETYTATVNRWILGRKRFK